MKASAKCWIPLRRQGWSWKGGTQPQPRAWTGPGPSYRLLCDVTGDVSVRLPSPSSPEPRQAVTSRRVPERLAGPRNLRRPCRNATSSSPMSPWSSCCDRRARVREAVERPQGGKKGRWVRAPAGGRSPSSVHQDPGKEARGEAPLAGRGSSIQSRCPRSPQPHPPHHLVCGQSAFYDDDGGEGEGDPSPQAGLCAKSAVEAREPGLRGGTRDLHSLPSPPPYLPRARLRQPPHLRGGRGSRVLERACSPLKHPPCLSLAKRSQ